MEKDMHGFADRKQKLDQHLQKFHSLRKEGKLKEAMAQYAKTVEYARESINQSLEVLENSISRIKSLKPERQARIEEITMKVSDDLEERDVLRDLLKNRIYPQQ